MARKPDYLKEHIKELLEPELVKHGFQPSGGKGFTRERGVFVDHLFFQLSRHGSKNFYLHISTSLAYDPSTTFESFGYLWGNRFDYSEKTDTDWCADTEEKSRKAVESIATYLDGEYLSWFGRFQDAKDALIELLLDTEEHEQNSLRIAFLLADLGRYVEMKKYAGPVMRRKPEESEDPAYTEQQADIAYNLIKAARTESLDGFFSDIIRRNKGATCECD